MSSRACITDTGTLTVHAETLAHRILVATYDDHSPRTHVLFFADDARYPFVTIVGKGLVRMFQEARFSGRLRRRHGRWQINQPLRISSKAAHHLQSSNGIFLADGNIP